MNFGDDLEDMLEDTDYVPSFAPREPKKTTVSKPSFKGSINTQNKSVPTPPSEPAQPQRRGMFALHRQSTKKQPLSFEDLIKKQNDSKSQQKNNERIIQANKSSSNLVNKKEDDNYSVFSAQRTTMRPPSRDREFKDETQSINVQRRNMKPPLSHKNKKKEDSDFKDNSSVQVKEPKNRYQSNDLNPLQDLESEELNSKRKVIESQLQFQKQSMQKLLSEERETRKQQVAKLKQLHEQELKKKLQLKDYEISKIKQFYEGQLALKNQKNNGAKEISSAHQKVQENMRQLKRIEQKINDQYLTFQNKKRDENSQRQHRKQAELQQKESQLRNLENRLSEMQDNLKEEKKRYYEETDRQRHIIDQERQKNNRRQIQLESIHRKREKQLVQEYDRKKQQLIKQQQKVRDQSLEIKRKQAQLQEQEIQLKKKIQEFNDSKRQSLDELHNQKTYLMDKQIEMGTKINDIAVKERQIEMLRSDLTNRAKILDLEKKKLQIQSQGKLDKNLVKLERRQNNFMKMNQTASSYETYHKSITQMRDQMLKTLPKFS